MPSRFRVSDERQKGTHSVELWQYNKLSGCSGPQTWSVATSSTTQSHSGTYRHMDDVIGNAPKRSRGPSGFTSNPMWSAKHTVDDGSGSGWTIQGTTDVCSPPDNFRQIYERRFTNLTLGRYLAGFSATIDPNGRLFTGVLANPSRLRDAQTYVSTEVRNQRGRGSDSNLYESLFEADKSFKLLTSYFKAARGIAMEAKKNNARGVAKEISGAYLMTRYGFKPLVQDIVHALDTMGSESRSVLQTSRSQISYTEPVTVTNKTTVDAGVVQCLGTITSSTEVSVRGWSTDQFTLSKAEALGLSGKNLLTVAWELMPYSFVIDWFANVGSFIGSAVPDFGLRQYSSGLSTKITQTNTYAASSITSTSSSWVVLGSPSASCTEKYEVFSRTPGLLAPTLQIKPDFRFSQLTRCADAFALMMQQLPRK